MTVAGVELDDGRRVWARLEIEDVQPLARVHIRISDIDQQGTVFLAPAQLVGTPPVAEALIVSIIEPGESVTDDVLLGADMPALGSRIELAGVTGLVVHIDPVLRAVTLADGERKTTVSLDEPEIGRE